MNKDSGEQEEGTVIPTFVIPKDSPLSDDERWPLMDLELTSDEQISLLGFIVNHTNCLIAKEDKCHWLPDLERIEEKIRGHQERTDYESRHRPAIISNGGRG